MASPTKSVPMSGGVAPRSSAKRTADEVVIDVDALLTAEVISSPSGKGKGPAKVARFNEPIDVDNPDTWVTPVPSSAGGPSGDIASQEYKDGLSTQERKCNDNGWTLPSGAVETADAASVGDEPPAAGEMYAAVGVPAFVAVPAAGNTHASGAAPVVGAVRGSRITAGRSKFDSKAVRASLSNRFRTNKFTNKFVRRAAVMTVVPAPRMVAGPPTPPQSRSTSDGGASYSEDGSGEDCDLDAVAEADVARGGAKDSADGAADADFNFNVEVFSSSGTAGQQPPPAPVRSTTPTSGAPASHVGELPAEAPPVQPTAEALASQLAARSCSPRILTAAFWMPDAQAVRATAHASGAGLPPIAPPAARRGVSMSGTARSALERVVSPSLPRSLPTTLPPVADAEDASSSDMDDDALVAAYITPPASPLPASGAESPARARRSLGKRRRDDHSRTARPAAAGAASSRDLEIEPLSLALHDVHKALRNGFSSVRRQLTRLRGELVFVKSQSASTLRRIDSIAAAADGRESGSRVVLERLEVLDRTVHNPGERLTTAGTQAPNLDGASGNSVELVAVIKELFLEALMKEIRTASSSSRVYPSAETINTLLIGAAAKVMDVSEEVAVKKVQDKMMLPVRKPAKGLALSIAYQYIKRVFWHLNGSLSSVAVSTFLKRTHALKNIGSRSTPSAPSTRRVLQQSPEECMGLLQAYSFVKDAHGRLAMLDVLANFLAELEATESMVTWMGPNNAIRVIRCVYGHFANVSFRVRTYLRNRAKLPSLLGGTGALNLGNKALFERELFLLHDVLPKDPDVHDGLQLIDGADPSRHVISVAPVVPAPPRPPRRPQPVLFPQLLVSHLSALFYR